MADLAARDAAAIARIAHLRFSPLAIAGGRGSRLIADDGRELIDFSASWGAASLGYAHPAVRAAVDAALSSQAGAGHISAITAPAVELAERLLALVPGPAGRKVWLGHSGSDANEAVARALLAATGRPRLIAFAGAYHGGSAGSMAVSGHPALPAAARAPGLVLLPYPASAEAVPAALAALEAALAGGDVAGLFYEPIQADGGMIVPAPGFLRAVQDRCRAAGTLTVDDEVKVGLGRTGHLLAAEAEGLTPDVLVLGKGLGGGLPISAVVGPAALMDHAPCFAIQTVHGNPVCAAAALAVLDTLERDRLAARAEAAGERLRAGLEGLGLNPRGRGLALGAPLPGRQAALTVLRAWQLGLVIYYVGPASDVLEFTPPLTITDADIHAGLAILGAALDDVRAGRVPQDAADAFAGW